MMNSIDRYAAVIDLAPIPLPEPEAGEPSREWIDDTAVRSHWVPTAPVKGQNVLKALSAVRADGRRDRHPLDKGSVEMSAGLRRELGIDDFVSARHVER